MSNFTSVPSTYEELLSQYQLLLQENKSLRASQDNQEGEPETSSVHDVRVILSGLISAVLSFTNPEKRAIVLYNPNNFLRQAVEDPPHPLLQEPVARLLGTFLDHKSLQAGRQVCSEWTKCMTPSFCQKSKVVAHFFCPDRRRDSRRDWFFSSSDSDDDETNGWKTVQNFRRVFPFPDDPTELSKFQNIHRPTNASLHHLKKLYWECKAGIVPSMYHRPSRMSTLASPSTHPSRIVQSQPTTSTSLGPIDLLHEADRNSTQTADDDNFYLPSPPVPTTLDLIGYTCPAAWLKMYGYVIKTLNFDFGTFQRRELYGDVESSFIAQLFQEYCPNLQSVRILKPNYNIDDGTVPLGPVGWDHGATGSSVTSTRINLNPMAGARFENITRLEMHAYRSDRIQCVKEFLSSVPNLKHLSLSMFSLSPDVETQVIQTAIQAGYMPNLVSLKLPMGIKSTTLLLLMGIEFPCLKELVLGRIRQSRWVRPIGQHVNEPRPEPILPSTLTEFLRNLSDTLEELSLNVSLTHPDEIGIPLISNDLPVLPFLKKFEYRHARPEFTENFNFLDNLPNLQDIKLTAESPNDELLARRLLADQFFSIVQTLQSIKLKNAILDFPSVVKLVRNFPRLKVLHAQFPLCANDLGNVNVRRPLSRFLFKLRKLEWLEELKVTCNLVEKDDFGYSVGFCLRHMKALRTFSFRSLKTTPRLTLFAVDSGFLKTPSLSCVELEDFIIYEEDRVKIETSLKKKLLKTKFTNCFIVNQLKDPELTPRDRSNHQEFSASAFNRRSETWRYDVNMYSDPGSGPQQRNPISPTETQPTMISSGMSFSSDDSFELGAFTAL